ncbi:MAG: tetratricopeptide repeat protein [Phycisphaerae bacterium]
MVHVARTLRHMGLLARRALMGSVPAAAMLAGTACTPQTKPYDVHQVSKSGAELYRTALELLWKSRARDEQGPERNASLDGVVRRLKAAVSNDPNCPLFHSKLGEVMLDIGQHDLAKDHFETSLDLCRNDWVPGWLGLARWARQRIDRDPAKLAEAEHYLWRAEQATDSIERHWGDLPGDARGLPGLGKLGLADSASGLAIPKERTGGWILIDFLCANEYPALFAGTSVLARMRARIVYERALIAEARGEPALTVIENLLISHRYDPDFAPATLERARQHYKRAEYRKAEDILLPLLRAEPLYQGCAELWLELAQVYSGWCLETLAEGECAKAEEAFVKVHDINENHVRGWLARAKLQYDVGSRLGRRDWLEGARASVGNVLDLIPTHPEGNELLRLIEVAGNTLNTEQDK